MLGVCLIYVLHPSHHGIELNSQLSGEFNINIPHVRSVPSRVFVFRFVQIGHM